MIQRQAATVLLPLAIGYWLSLLAITGPQKFGLLINFTQALAGQVPLSDLMWRGIYPQIHDRHLVRNSIDPMPLRQRDRKRA